MKQKMKYANKLGIPFVAVIGDEEEKNQTVTVKNMETGEQKTVSKGEAIEILKKDLGGFAPNTPTSL